MGSGAGGQEGDGRADGRADGRSEGREGERELATNNLDLAAYLVVRGLDPSGVEIGEKGFRHYHFAGSDAFRYTSEYWANTPVPVRDFALARAKLKKLHGTAKHATSGPTSGPASGRATGTTTSRAGS